MGEKKTDRRTLKTKKALSNALAELLMEKEIRKVTVQEIADKADVNRVTFYKHFYDVYDLYENIEKEVLIELGLLMLELENLPSEKFFAHLTDYIDKNRMVFKMIFCPNTTGQLRTKFDRLYSGLILKIQSEKQELDITDSSLLYQNCYRSQGSIAIISKWVLNNFTESTEFITKILSDLDHNTEKFITNK